MLRIRSESVAAEAIAVGAPGVFVEAMHAIDGVDPEVMAAVRCAEGGDCDDGQSDSDWVAAFGPANTYGDESLAVAQARAICEHGIDPSPADGCNQGGRIQWVPDSLSSEIRFAYFPEYQDQIEQELAEGLGPSWRLDPVETVAGYWIDEHGLCIDDFSAGYYPRCRVGMGHPIIDGASASVIVTLQWATPVNEPEVLYYETYYQRITLERTGSAWWVTSFSEDPAITHGKSSQGRESSDRLWAECCQTVLVDIEEGVGVDR